MHAWFLLVAVYVYIYILFGHENGFGPHVYICTPESFSTTGNFPKKTKITMNTKACRGAT